MACVVQATDLTKQYQNTPVVHGINFEIHGGECFGILGPNGAGKSTTMRMVTGLSPVDGGELLVFDQPMTPEATQVRRRLGVVAQEDNLDDDLLVWENILVYGRYFQLSDRQIKPRIQQLLAFAKLEDRANAPVRTLSGGMKRRLVIARALVAEPELMVLDEPTTGLDPQARHLIWQRLRQLREQGITLLLTTHYMEEAAQLCDRLLILDSGHILDQGTPLELINRHVEPEVVEVRSSIPLLLAELPKLPARLEQVGDTLFCYTHEARAVLEKLGNRHDLTLLARPANLEDVFLKLTGRELRD
ncbi:ABC transporter related protein [Magnetococcus marinus MC-1]|uniref:ABC transporter related protein n=1 Tax=Magnetococcus marinus (strain ATCC BAA-1437 / JCM 17883 / MC-1) TaxID=156889 RepID=A0LCV2_MAGMM|nr:ABC transporter related protein [Magnetococcus marinus MC-1]